LVQIAPETAELNGDKLLRGGLWRKRVNVISKPSLFPEIFSYAIILVLLLPTTCKSQHRKKLANTRNGNFWENGQKIG